MGSGIIQQKKIERLLWPHSGCSHGVVCAIGHLLSIIHVQLTFRLGFNIISRGRVPDRNRGVFINQKGASEYCHYPREHWEDLGRNWRISPASNILGIYRIVKQHLHMHPYKLIAVHALLPRDYEVRELACESMLAGLPRVVVTFSSNEAYFHLSGLVNKQKMHFWSVTNLIHSPLHYDRVTVWCVLSRNGIVRPYFS